MGAWGISRRQVGVSPGVAGRAVIATALAIAFAACSRPPDEEVLRARIAAMATALEERQAGRFMSGVADDFTGQRGQLDRRQLGALVRVETLRHQSLGISLGPMEVTMHGERATVRFKVFARGGSGSFIPQQAGVYQVESGWRKGGDDWVVYSAQWERAGSL
jgi:hypothetical protein